MKRIVLGFLSSVLFLVLNGQTIRYVKQGATGTGTGSWENASGSIQAMITASAANDEIWVAAGSYSPPSANMPFLLEKPLKIYGGFPASGGNMSDRNSTLFSTILNGLNLARVLTINANSITNANTVIDGFSFVNGNGDAGSDNYTGPGGAVLIFSGSPTLQNCSFTNNSSFDGGAIYVYNNAPLIQNCALNANKGFYGGAIYIRSGTSVIQNCIISNNSNVIPNDQTNMGGGIYIEGGSPMLNNSTIENNSAGLGGGISITGSGTKQINQCLIRNNVASQDGGGINLDWVSSGTTILTDCQVEANHANRYGGGIFTIFKTFTVNRSIFLRNSADNNGSAVYLYTHTSINNIANSLFVENYGSGSVIYKDGNPSTSIINTTIANNSSPSGAINNTGGNLAISNGIIYGNTGASITGTQPVTNNSIVEGASPMIAALDDIFADPQNGNYRLAASSPAIDAGGNTWYNITTYGSTDLTGNTRIVGSAIDIGAYEFDPAALPVSFGTLSASIRNNQLAVQWQTLTETNNDHFVIEASTDGLWFQAIATVVSKAEGGASNLTLEYEWEANVGALMTLSWIAIALLVGGGSILRNKRHLLAALLLSMAFNACTKNRIDDLNGKENLFIRIAQVDKDGTKTYSKIIKVNHK